MFALVLRSLAALLVASVLVACESGGELNRSDDSSNSTSADIVAVPITKPTQPSGFAGDDDEFVRVVHEYFDKADVTAQMSDRTLVTVGREFCFVLSGGGMLADKVDFWAGTRHLENGPDVPIFSAAWDVYCPDLAEGYRRIRLGSRSQEPTARQRVDLATFVATLHQPGGVPSIERMSTTEVERAAATLCRMSFDTGWERTPPVVRLTRPVPQAARLQYLAGLALGFCPDVTSEMMASLQPRV